MNTNMAFRISILLLALTPGVAVTQTSSGSGGDSQQTTQQTGQESKRSAGSGQSSAAATRSVPTREKLPADAAVSFPEDI